MLSKLVTKPLTLPRSLVNGEAVDPKNAENRVIKEDPYAIEIRVAVAIPKELTRIIKIIARLFNLW